MAHAVAHSVAQIWTKIFLLNSSFTYYEKKGYLK